MADQERSGQARRLAASARRHLWIVTDVRSAPLAFIGTTLLLVGLLGGLAVTRVGASRTGELALDVQVSTHRTGALTAVARVIDVAFSPGVALALLVLACGLVWLRSRQAAVAIALLTIAGWLSVEVGKVVVRRPRPPSASVHALVSETAPDSYPSGHTAFAAALVFAVAATLVLMGRRSRTVWVLGVPLLLLVGASRLYLGAHYLADVSASVVFAGGTILLVLSLVGLALTGSRRAEGGRP